MSRTLGRDACSLMMVVTHAVAKIAFTDIDWYPLAISVDLGVDVVSVLVAIE